MTHGHSGQRIAWPVSRRRFLYLPRFCCPASGGPFGEGLVHVSVPRTATSRSPVQLQAPRARSPPPPSPGSGLRTSCLQKARYGIAEAKKRHGRCGITDRAGTGTKS
jgi:hypothetical protein